MQISILFYIERKESNINKQSSVQDRAFISRILRCPFPIQNRSRIDTAIYRLASLRFALGQL